MSKRPQPSDDLIQKFAKFWNLDSEIKLIRKVENFVYSTQLNGDDRILRITFNDQRSALELENELKWVCFLKENGRSVVTPLVSSEKKLVHSLTDISGDVFHCACFEYAEGSPVKESLNLDTKIFYRLGAEMAKFHQLSEELNWSQTDRKFERAHWDAERAIQKAKKSAESLGKMDQIRPFLTKMSQFSKKPSEYGLIHADIHTGNFFYDDEQLAIFDFDDSCYHWYMFDLIIPLLNLEFEAYTLERFECFAQRKISLLDGYQSVRSLLKEDLERLEFFREYRNLILNFWCKGLLEENQLEPHALKWCKSFTEYYDTYFGSASSHR